MTYNIRHGMGMDRELDLERTARIIASSQPDFVVLNEVDHGTARSFHVLQADSLGNTLDMDAVFGRSIDYDGGQYGNAFLSKHPILKFEIIDLSTDSLLEGRSVFLAHIDLDGDTLVILGTHLGLTPEERTNQVSIILEHLPDHERILLAGDFNFEPASDNYRRITLALRDGMMISNVPPEDTFPADEPDRRIDYIFVGSSISVINAQTPDQNEIATASDHRPQIIHFK